MLFDLQSDGNVGKLGHILGPMGRFTGLPASLEFEMNFSIWFQPRKQFLVVPVLLRFAFIPLFLFCNYQPLNVARILPVYINNDWIYWGTGIAMGFTSGYLRWVSMLDSLKRANNQSLISPPAPSAWCTPHRPLLHSTLKQLVCLPQPCWSQASSPVSCSQWLSHSSCAPSPCNICAIML